MQNMNNVDLNPVSTATSDPSRKQEVRIREGHSPWRLSTRTGADGNSAGSAPSRTGCVRHQGRKLSVVMGKDGGEGGAKEHGATTPAAPSEGKEQEARTQAAPSDDESSAGLIPSRMGTRKGSAHHHGRKLSVDAGKDGGEEGAKEHGATTQADAATPAAPSDDESSAGLIPSRMGTRKGSAHHQGRKFSVDAEKDGDEGGEAYSEEGNSAAPIRSDKSPPVETYGDERGEARIESSSKDDNNKDISRDLESQRADHKSTSQSQSQSQSDQYPKIKYSRMNIHIAHAAHQRINIFTADLTTHKSR
jgi:hypothetical protein